MVSDRIKNSKVSISDLLIKLRRFQSSISEPDGSWIYG